jgi:hypothetical protein
LFEPARRNPAPPRPRPQPVAVNGPATHIFPTSNFLERIVVWWKTVGLTNALGRREFSAGLHSAWLPLPVTSLQCRKCKSSPAQASVFTPDISATLQLCNTGNHGASAQSTHASLDTLLAILALHQPSYFILFFFLIFDFVPTTIGFLLCLPILPHSLAKPFP